MSSKSKTFTATRGSVSVYTDEKDDQTPQSKVGVNWCACGEVTVAEAVSFRDALNKAIRHAKGECRRIDASENGGKAE